MDPRPIPSINASVIADADTGVNSGVLDFLEKNKLLALLLFGLVYIYAPIFCQFL